MATVRTYPWVRHFLGTPTGHVVHLRRGQVVHEGVGQAFWFRPASSVLSEIPVDDQELPVFFPPPPPTTRTSPSRPASRTGSPTP
jgi:hypothetical protein